MTEVQDQTGTATLSRPRHDWRWVVPRTLVLGVAATIVASLVRYWSLSFTTLPDSDRWRLRVGFFAAEIGWYLAAVALGTVVLVKSGAVGRTAAWVRGLLWVELIAIALVNVLQLVYQLSAANSIVDAALGSRWSLGLNAAAALLTGVAGVVVLLAPSAAEDAEAALSAS